MRQHGATQCMGKYRLKPCSDSVKPHPEFSKCSIDYTSGPAAGTKFLPTPRAVAQFHCVKFTGFAAPAFPIVD